MIFDALVFGHARNNVWRALISIIAIAFGVATALALALTSTLSIGSLDYDRALFSQRVDYQILPFGNRLPQGLLASVRYLDRVASANPIIDRPITIGVDRNGSGGESARLIGVDLLKPLPGVGGFEQGRPGPFAMAGSFIDPGAIMGTNGAILSAATATRLRLHHGVAFRVLSGTRIVRLRVANFMPASATNVDSNVVFVDIATAQLLTNDSGIVDRIDVVGKLPLDGLRKALVTAIGGRARVVVPERSGFSLGALTNGIETTFAALASIGLAVGALLVFNAIGTSVAHRRGDIGTLRTLGVAPASIVMTFVGEGAAYGALGGILGAVLAELAIQTVARIAGSHQSVGENDVWTIALAVAVGVVVAVAASIPPAVSAARIAPALAARQGSFEASRSSFAMVVAQALVGTGAFALGLTLAFHPSPAAWFVLGFPLCFAMGTVLFVAPFWRMIATVTRRVTCDAPPSLLLAGRTLVSMPRRIAVALAALSVAVFSAVAFDIASGSFATSLHGWVEHGIAGDIVVRPAGAGGTFDAGVAAAVRATPGVREVAAVRTIQTQAGSTDVAVRGDDAAVPHVMMTEPPAEAAAPLAATLHVRSGDVVALRTAHHDLRVRITAVRPDFSDSRGAIVIARSVLRDVFGDDRIDALRLTIDPNANPTNVATAIARRLAPRRIVTVTTRELRDRLTGVFDGTFAFVRTLAAVVVAIASLGFASALSALIFERRFELRMLRTLGTRRPTIVRMLVSEALVIALCGSALGSIAGVAFAAIQLYVVDPLAIGFAIPLTVPFASVSAVLVAAIAASVLAPIIAAPAAYRIATDHKP